LKIGGWRRLEWDGWNGATRAWIVSHEKAVPIFDVIDTYARIAAEFDRWLADRIVLKYQPYLDSIRAVPSSARPNSPANGRVHPLSDRSGRDLRRRGDLPVGSARDFA
jgi:hypothetical protein